MNQRLESSNRVKNFENVEPEESIEQIERNEVIQEIQNSTNFEVKETKKEDEIDLNKSPEEIWQEIKGAILKVKKRTSQIDNIWDLLELSFTKIVKGTIGNTLVRDIINAMLRLEGQDKITSYCDSKKDPANKERVENAKEKLKNLVTEGKLGSDTQEEFAKYLKENPVVKEEEIDLSGSAEEIWKRIKLPATIFYNGQQIVIHTIQDFIRLKKTCIIEGKIGNTLVREIINAMLELKEDKKITSHRLNDKGKANKLRLEKARRLLEQKVTKGGLGKEAQADYVKSEIQEKQEKIQNLILEKINFIKSKIINENKIEFDSMEEYVIGEILEKYLINENGESFRLETNTNFQVEIEKDNNSRNSKLDFLISKEFTIKGWDSIVIEWHPIRLDLKKKKLKKEIENTENKEKKEELRKRIEKIDQKDSEAIEKIKKEYEAKRQDLAEKKFVKETIVIRTFQEKYNREDLYEFLKEFTITNSTFPENQEEFTTQFQNIYSQISTIQEKKKQRVTRIKIEEYLEENNEHSIQELTDEQITDIWNTSFNFDGSKNKISQRIKNSETHTKKEKKDTQIGYKRRNLIAFYNCDEYKLKDEELEAHINQKIEEIRSEISELESILEPEQDLEETQEQGFEDTQVEELIEPVEIYQEFQLTSY